MSKNAQHKWRICCKKKLLICFSPFCLPQINHSYFYFETSFCHLNGASHVHNLCSHLWSIWDWKKSFPACRVSVGVLAFRLGVSPHQRYLLFIPGTSNAHSEPRIYSISIFRSSSLPTVAMSSSSCKNLPQELIMAIADNIQDHKSLRAFTLVCKAWTNPARDHLFASLNIDGFKVLDKIKAANIMSTYTPFLRKLCLTPRDFHDKFWRDVISFLADFRAPRLRSLVLIDLTWHSLSPDERSAFLRPFESIVSLRLGLYTRETPHHIAAIICSFPHLRKLYLMPSFRWCQFSGPEPLSPDLRLPQRLSTIHVTYNHKDYRLILEWLSSIPEQLSIHTFRLNMRWHFPQDLNLVNMFLRALGRSLEVFWCYPHGISMSSASTIELF